MGERKECQVRESQVEMRSCASKCLWAVKDTWNVFKMCPPVTGSW